MADALFFGVGLRGHHEAGSDHLTAGVRATGVLQGGPVALNHKVGRDHFSSAT